MKIKLYIKETKGNKFWNWFNPSFCLLVSIWIIISQTVLAGLSPYAMSFVFLIFACYLGYSAYKRKKEFIEQIIECEKYEVLKDEK